MHKVPAWGRSRAEGLGAIIATATAFHNQSKGLSLAPVLGMRGTPVRKAGLWAILTGLPQPLMAAPAAQCVATVRPVPPESLGIAGGR